jgi:hypothetical protein
LQRITAFCIVALFFYILLFNVVPIFEVHAQPFAVHTSAGKIIGEHADNEVEAFALGLLSHLVLDTIPRHQYGIDWWGGDDSGYIAIDGICSLAVLQSTNFDTKQVAGIIGATLPDIVDAYNKIKGRPPSFPPHNGWPGYVDMPPLNKAQSALLTILIAGVTIRF